MDIPSPPRSHLNRALGLVEAALSLTCLVPALRAARVQPAAALRSE